MVKKKLKYMLKVLLTTLHVVVNIIEGKTCMGI